MQTKSVSTLRPARSTKPPPRGTRFRSRLAEIHAKALHRLVPPVYFDDDGYVCEDNSHMPEGDFPIVSYWHAARQRAEVETARLRAEIRRLRSGKT